MSRKRDLILHNDKSRYVADNSLISALSKIRYWTLWFVARHGMLLEAKQMIISDKHWNTDIDKRNPDDQFTALHYACKHGHIEMIKLLLEHGANVSARIADGRTCLHLAATYSNKNIVTELLIVGADPFAVDSLGMIPLDLARQNKNVSAIRMLEKWVEFQYNMQVDSHGNGIQISKDTEDCISLDVLPTMSAKSTALQMTETRVQRLKDGLLSDAMSVVGLSSLRLLEKHACLCSTEGFEADARDSLLLRWTLANDLHKGVYKQELSLIAAVAIGRELAEYCAIGGDLVLSVEHIDSCVSLLNSSSLRRELSSIEVLDLMQLYRRRIELVLSLRDEVLLHSLPLNILVCFKLSRLIHDYSHGEPAEIYPYLFQECIVLERLGRISEVVDKTRQVSMIARRIFGVTHPDSIRASLEHIRVTLLATVSLERDLATCHDQFQAIKVMSSNLMAELKSLNQNNSTAFALLKCCCEYNSLADLLARGFSVNLSSLETGNTRP
jgi:hypothetical protein